MARASPGRYSTPAFAPTIRTLAGTSSRKCGIAPSAAGPSSWWGTRIQTATALTCPGSSRARRPAQGRQAAEGAGRRATRASGGLQGARRQGPGRGRLDHQGAGPHRRAERQHRGGTGDPRHQPEPGRPVRQHRVRLRLLADLRGAAQAVARWRARGGGFGQRRSGAGAHVGRRQRDQQLHVDRRPGEPGRLHRGRLRQRRQATPVRRVFVLVARPHRRRPSQA